MVAMSLLLFGKQAYGAQVPTMPVPNYFASLLPLILTGKSEQDSSPSLFLVPLRSTSLGRHSYGPVRKARLWCRLLPERQEQLLMT